MLATRQRCAVESQCKISRRSRLKSPPHSEQRASFRETSYFSRYMSLMVSRSIWSPEKQKCHQVSPSQSETLFFFSNVLPIWSPFVPHLFQWPVFAVRSEYTTYTPSLSGPDGSGDPWEGHAFSKLHCLTRDRDSETLRGLLHAAISLMPWSGKPVMPLHLSWPNSVLAGPVIEPWCNCNKLILLQGPLL